MASFGQPLGHIGRSLVLDSPQPIYDRFDTYPPNGLNDRQLTPVLNVGEYAGIILSVVPDSVAPFNVPTNGCLRLTFRWAQKPITPSAGLTSYSQDLWGYGVSTLPEASALLGRSVVYPFLTIFGLWTDAAGLTDQTNSKRATVNVWGTNRELRRQIGREHTPLLKLEHPTFPPGITNYRLPPYAGPAFITQAFASGAVTFEGNTIEPNNTLPPAAAPDGRWWREYTLPAGGGDIVGRKVALPESRNYVRVNNTTAGNLYVTLNIAIGEAAA